MVMRSGFRLHGGLDQTLLAETQQCTPKLGQTLDITLAFVVEDIYSLATLKNVRAGLLILGQVAGWMLMILHNSVREVSWLSFT